MKKPVLAGALAVATTLTLAGIGLAQSAGGLSTLRGAEVDESVAVEQIFHQETQRFNRAYRQQPPLIPHSVDQYQMDLKANQCLGCHDWSNAGDRDAPTLSMTHYLDRDGNERDHVAGTRWFCNQCHVPQVNAPGLVDNSFEPSSAKRCVPRQEREQEPWQIKPPAERSPVSSNGPGPGSGAPAASSASGSF